MSAPLSGLSIDSVTGIDVSLPVAGAGARAFAFLIDWHIRLVLALAWYAAAALIYNGGLSLAPPPETDPRWFGAVVAPPLAIYFLYHYVLELVMRGRTPGKRMAGVRVIARDGGTPGAGALLARNVFRLIDSLPLCYGVGLIATVVTRDHVRIGDMAAGTLLAYEGADLPLPLPPVAAASRLDAVGAEVIAELLARWSTLAPQARTQLARQVLARYQPDATGLAEAGESALRAQLEHLSGATASPG
jgi:uncharacterized RDD family membrane protein YckC